MADTRIIDLPNQVTIGEGSFVAVDSDSDGTRKYDLAQIAAVTDANVIASMAERAAEIATEAAERRIDDAIDAMGDISELAVPLMSSDVRGGAKLGDGLALSDGVLSVSMSGLNATDMSDVVAEL